MKMLLFFLFIVVGIFQTVALEKRKCSIFTGRYEVHIINDLPSSLSESPPLELHCASGDDDLGYRILSVNDDFHWHFCENFFHNTLFFCHFWWGAKEKKFNVFDYKRKARCDVTCNWIVKSDGIYFSGDKHNPSKSLKKEFDWDVGTNSK